MYLSDFCCGVFNASSVRKNVGIYSYAYWIKRDEMNIMTSKLDEWRQFQWFDVIIDNNDVILTIWAS